MNRAALYARVSTVGHGQDVGLQLDELRSVARQRGWTIAAEYIDEGYSGTKARRPALDRLMLAAENREFDVVAVWRFDRFARSTRHLLCALDEFRRHGIEFLSLREAVDTSTAMGRAMFTIIAAIAELERDIIVERITAGIRRAQANGSKCGRPFKHGDETMEQARELLDQDMPVKQIAATLGIPRSTIRRLIERMKAEETTEALENK